MLFLDEPFSALDFEMTLFIRAKLQDAHLATGTTMVIVSHDLEDAVFLADRIQIEAADQGQRSLGGSGEAVRMGTAARILLPQISHPGRSRPGRRAFRRRLKVLCAWQWLAMVASIVLVWVVELINSALEALADALSTEHHPLLGRAKDLGSAAVMCCLWLVALTWAVALWP